MRLCQVALKIVVANRPVQHHLKIRGNQNKLFPSASLSIWCFLGRPDALDT